MNDDHNHRVRSQWMLNPDRPIERRSEDTLGRIRFADSVAKQIVASPADEGFVMGLLGPWGSGKTSILNMICEFLETESDIVVMHFNPWLFSGTEQLVTHFFKELSSQLLEKPDEKLQKLGTSLANYGELLGPSLSANVNETLTRQ